MARTISKPGPPPKSCLTCRRRRKKCDLSKPSCKRCLKGGYDCLGYGNVDPRSKSHQKNSNVPVASSSQPVAELDPVEVVKPGIRDSVPKDCQHPADTDADCDPKTSIIQAALLYRASGTSSSPIDDCIAPSSGEFDCSWPQERQLVACSRSATYQSSTARRLFGTISGPAAVSNDLVRIIGGLCQAIPPSVNAIEMMREDYFGCVIYEYHLKRADYWFIVPRPAIRNAMLAHLKWSKRMTWTMYLAARLFQALGQNAQSPGSTSVQGCIGWIDKLEKKFTVSSFGRPPLSDVADRFAVQIELAFLNFAVVDSILGHRLLQKALPNFFQLAAADSNLYMEHPNGNLAISFPRILSAPRYHLRRFVIYDTVAALVLGVPPLIEYGYDGECDSKSHGLEWVHGIPVALLDAISQVNSWRAGSRITIKDWETLEKRVLAWQPSSAMLTEGATAENISAARMAVQEGWRNVVLIYIYMGICRVSSHDSRVQASVLQIVQLAETVATLSIGVHMFTHCVVAGLAARFERHRVFLHETLLSFKDNRVWIFRGPQFGQVLYHLWHGVGAGGAPVTWDDYVRSRCAIVPL